MFIHALLFTCVTGEAFRMLCLERVIVFITGSKSMDGTERASYILAFDETLKLGITNFVSICTGE